MKVQQLERKFNYNGIDMVDPNPGWTPEAVKASMAGQYPELLNATIEGPFTKGGICTYKFVRAAGGKGADCDQLRKRMQAAAANPEMRLMVDTRQDASMQAMAATLANICGSRPNGKVLNMPSTAYGLWA